MSDQNKPKSKLTLGSQVLQALFENGKSPLSVQFIRWKLWRKWPEIMGPTIAENCEPVGYKQGVLFLWVKNSTWMQQMVFMRDPMTKKINDHLKMRYVTEIRLTLDRRSVPADAQGQEDLKDSMATIIGEDEI